ncbi:hypothetical protein [Spirulina subsalsa]|uniref:hypothetical protein n=1 Tax=Spirulina subsalsa TaxID=54311 RepID=UPI00232D487D|nr:hypothetical protein [Spirulina subsalsa]
MLGTFAMLCQSDADQKQSVFAMLKQAPISNRFETADAVDDYLNHERNSWDSLDSESDE